MSHPLHGRVVYAICGHVASQCRCMDGAKSVTTTPGMCASCAKKVSALETVDIVFDGPPGPESGCFVEVERLDGTSINVGEWIGPGAPNGLWRLRLRIVREVG